VTGRKRATDRIDLYREHNAEYVASQRPAIVEVGPARYLVAAGKGVPGGPEFQSAMGSLFRAGYTLKFLYRARGHDFKVPGPEGVWGVRLERGPFQVKNLAKTPWRLVIRLPEFVTKADLRVALHRLAEKGRTGPVEVALEPFREGTCVQMLHVGPYADEGRTIRVMIAFAREHRLSIVGPHHEIYLSDPRRVPPARLRTILRLGVKKIGPRH
jgi:hypothetical protein